MSIQTPTSEVHSPLDVGALAKLAGEFFAALPGERAEPQAALNVAPSATALGGVPAPVNVLPAGSSLGPLGNATVTKHDCAWCQCCATVATKCVEPRCVFPIVGAALCCAEWCA